MRTKANGVANNDHTNGTALNWPGHEGRAGDGRFAMGNKGGPGNPYARQTAALRKAAADAATPEDIREVLAALLVKAKAGDSGAARLWLAYSAGRPGLGADPDTLDAHELRVRREGVATVEDMKALFERMPAALMCELAGRLSAEVCRQMREAFAGGVVRQTENEEKGAELVPEKAGPYMASKADWAPDWLREGRGMPDELARTFEACPAYMPDQHGHDRVPHAYAAFLRSLRAGLLGALPGGVKAGNECHLVTQPDDKRKNGRKHKKAGAGKVAPAACGAGSSHDAGCH